MIYVYIEPTVEKGVKLSPINHPKMNVARNYFAIMNKCVTVTFPPGKSSVFSTPEACIKWNAQSAQRNIKSGEKIKTEFHDKHDLNIGLAT